MVEQARDQDPPASATALVERIRTEVAAAGGALPFDRFMGMALYEPGLGYYTGARSRVGRGGDFVTSVSVGRCFGMLLARHLAPKLEAMGQCGDGELLVAEPGAEGGELAADVIGELAVVLSPEVFQRVRYVAVEPFGSKQQALAAALGELGVAHARVIDGWGELRGARGVVIANEILDAMPVKRLRFSGGEWVEVCVAEAGDRLVESTRPLADPAIEQQSTHWPRDLEQGFTVEHNPGLSAWFAEMAESFEELHACLIDYGLERSADFFDPGRREGTLRGYRLHQLIDDPLSAPGETDLTAHVDFERAAACAVAAGLEVLGLTDQHRFLVKAARGWLLEIESRGGAPDPETAKLLRQFQSLSHPAAMGMAFKVLEVAKPAQRG